MRRHLAWPIALPLAVIGTLAGHALGYRAAVPDAQARARELAASGHGYLEYAPLGVGLCSAFALLAFVGLVIHTSRGGRTHGAQVKLIAAIPPVAYVLQEVLERLLHDGHLPWAALGSAPVVIGLLAQIPFALLAASIAYLLSAVAERLGAVVAAWRPRPLRPSILLALAAAVDLPVRPAPATGYAGRGPPLLTS
jgi:hypothetical protein